MKRKVIIKKSAEDKLLLDIDDKRVATVNHNGSVLVHSYIDGRIDRHIILNNDEEEIVIESIAEDDWIKFLQGGEGPDSIKINIGSDRTGVEKDIQVYIKGNVTYSLDCLKKYGYDINTHSVVFTY